MSYIVGFATRSFDLEILRRAIADRQPASSIERIISGYEAAVRVDHRPLVDAVQRLGGVVTQQFRIINAATIEIAPQAIAAVRQIPGVVRVDPDLVLLPNGGAEVSGPGPAVARSTNANNHNADYVQQTLGIKATGFAIGSLHTGLDSNMGGSGRPHMIFFRGANSNDRSGGGIGGSLMLANVAMSVVLADDPHGYGTVCASASAGNGWNNPAGDFGHGLDAFFVGYSLCQSQPSCATGSSTEILTYQRAVVDRIQFNMPVLDMGYQGDNDPLSPINQASDNCAVLADQLEFSEYGVNRSHFHCLLNGVGIGVAQTDTKVLWASTPVGPQISDPRRFVPDIVANGDSIVGALKDLEGGTVISTQGIASSQVAGAALLVKAARPATTARELKAILLAHTEDISAANPFRDRNALGMGYLRDDFAVDNARLPGHVLTGSIASTSTPNQHLISVTQGSSVNIALTWFREIVTGVNYSDLGLRVMNGSTVVAQNDDPRNTYEVVRFTAPITGSLTIEVYANSLEVSPLTYGLATSAGLIGSASHYTFYGSGCAGTLGIPTLVVSRTPVAGQAFTLGLARANPGAFASFWFGASDASYLGISLPYAFGSSAPGCTLLASPDVQVLLPIDGAGTSLLPLTIPADPSLMGAVLFNQAAVFDAVNPLQLVFTQGGRMTVGAF